MSDALFQIVSECCRNYPVEAAKILDSLETDEGVAVLRQFDVKDIEILAPYLSHYLAARMLENSDPKKFAKLLSALPTSLLAKWLRLVENETLAPLLADIPEVKRTELKRLMSYASKSAGALMDATVQAIDENVTIGECIQTIRSVRFKTMYYIYFCNASHSLTGVMNLRELLAIRDVKESVKDHMNRDVVSLNFDASYFDILRHPGWQRFHSLPVIDSHNNFLGVIRYRQLRSVEHEVETAAHSRAVKQVGADLGELYALGMSALFESASTVFTDRER